MGYILALDQGTTSSRAIIFDSAGAVISVAQKEFTQFFPQPGWVEHDPNEIWSSQVSVALEAVSRKSLSWDDIQAIGITNQRETTIVWDRQTGEPLYNAIVWQDRRTSARCEQLLSDGLGPTFQEKTGLVLDAYFSGTKLEWILNNVEGARRKAEKGQLCFGTVDSWLLWKLTDGLVHATDVSNASRTLLFNIHTLEWDKDLLKIFDIPESMLPRVGESSEVFGESSHRLMGRTIPLAGVAGDQHAALFGQLCIHPGMLKNTYGTGCFMMLNIGELPIPSKHKLLTTVAWKVNGKVSYALEGSIFVAGAAVQWLRDGLGLIQKSADSEALAASVEDSGGIYFVPAFTGLGAPHWDGDARGVIVGMSRGTKAGHIARATLEAISLQVLEVLEAMEADSGVTINSLRVDGGATSNNLLMQIQADILGVPIERPAMTEVTALGAAYLAGLATGVWTGTDELLQHFESDRDFLPREEMDRTTLITGWRKAIQLTKLWSADDSSAARVSAEPQI